MPTVNFPLARRYNAFVHVAESKGAHQFFSLSLLFARMSNKQWQVEFIINEPREKLAR